MEQILSYIPEQFELTFLIGVCIFINTIFLIIIRLSMKIAWLRILFLFFLGIALFFIIKFLQFSQWDIKTFDTFFLNITVGVNPFIETFTHSIETNIQSLFWNPPVDIGINTLAALLEEVGKILMFSLFVVYHKQPIVRNILGFFLWIFLIQSIYIVIQAFQEAQTGWEILGGKIFFVFLSILVIIYHLKSKKEYVITNIAGSLYYMLIIALGFACIENIAYITNSIYQPDRLNISQMLISTAIRIGAGSASHIFFSLVFVFFYSQGVFGNIALIDRKSSKNIKKSFWWLKAFGIWKKSSFHTAYLIEKTLQGWILSIVLHTVYNSLHAYGGEVGDGRFSLLAILVVIVGFISFFLYVLGESRNRAHYSLIQEKIQMGKKIREIQGN